MKYIPGAAILAASGGMSHFEAVAFGWAAISTAPGANKVLGLAKDSFFLKGDTGRSAELDWADGDLK